MKETAEIISKSIGQSGKNIDYLLNLNQYFMDNKICDDYIRIMTDMVMKMKHKSKL